MHLQKLAIDGVFRATPARKRTRSFDWYRADALARALPPDWRPTTGSTHTALPGQVEGLHCQTGHRVVTCVSGRVAFVVVDVRVGAPTFGRWIPMDLDTVERVSVIVPPNAAWGFQAVTAGAALLSLHTGDPEGIRLHPQDPDLAITWPMAVVDGAGELLGDVLGELPVYVR